MPAGQFNRLGISTTPATSIARTVTGARRHHATAAVIDTNTNACPGWLSASAWASAQAVSPSATTASSSRASSERAEPVRRRTNDTR